MGKGTPKKKGHDADTFVLQGNSQTYYQNKVVHHFERQKTEGRYIHPSMRDIDRPKLIVPQFNTDRINYTPAFTLPSEPLDRDYYLNKHLSKIQQYQPISE